MPVKYALEDKIRKYLAEHHGISNVVVTGNRVNAAGGLFTVEGVVTSRKLDELASAIKQRLAQ